ncbi:hypothetical protein H8A99_42950 [Bradyrhizobium sp. Arg68]|uniref:hypothetical protein n=1 Tax=Bradyrhizobium ivorense TaxID=2511166 RepID=UPI001E516BB7|nr:hypothetical protein [Bradyrhizobium ivorense]MCC8942994.1 hypothetical protein [Bradyrhizobium ivorense]
MTKPPGYNLAIVKYHVKSSILEFHVISGINRRGNGALLSRRKAVSQRRDAVNV